jgi:hypothetical protein
MICRHCGGETRRDGTTEYYELHHHYHEDDATHTTVVGADGQTISVPVPSDVSTPLELVGVFCSAKCLTDFVQAHIGPDVAGE